MGTLKVNGKMSTMVVLIILSFLIVLAIELFIIFKNKNNNPESDTNGDANNAKLVSEFEIALKQRMDLLKKMGYDYDKWIAYNQENSVIEIDGKPYYFFIFEYVDHEDEFMTKVHANKNYINMAWNDVMKDQSENFPFIKEETNEKLIHNMYRIGMDNVNEKVIRYYWTDPLEKTIIKKESVFDIWHDPNNKKSGVIGIGHNVSYVLDDKTIHYSNFVHWFDLSLANLTILAITFIVFLFDSNKIKTFFIFAVISSYLINYLSSKELVGSFGTENTKIDNINNSVLGISFLIGVNTFILNALRKDFTINMFTESGLIFSLSLLLLMTCMFKTTDYITIHDLMANRISNQMIFNMSIILNMIIIVNYIIYITSLQRNKK